MKIKEDAEKYTSEVSFIHQYGDSVAEWIDAEPGSSVLDLGCGNGVLTKVLSDKGYRVKGMDASEALLNIAREKYPEIEFIQGNTTNFVLPEPVDVVFSNSVFHWIDREKQSDLLRCVYNALKRNGQFVFEIGGCNNNCNIHGVLADIFREHGFCYKMPLYIPPIDEFASLLENAGFQVRYAVVLDKPTELKDENEMEDWIKMFVNMPFTVIPSECERESMIEQAVKKLRNSLFLNGKWYVDYARIRIKAGK